MRLGLGVCQEWFDDMNECMLALVWRLPLGSLRNDGCTFHLVLLPLQPNTLLKFAIMGQVASLSAVVEERDHFQLSVFPPSMWISNPRSCLQLVAFLSPLPP